MDLKTTLNQENNKFKFLILRSSANGSGIKNKNDFVEVTVVAKSMPVIGLLFFVKMTVLNVTVRLYVLVPIQYI